MNHIFDYFQRVAEVLIRIPAEPVARIIEIMRTARAEGRRIFIFGNGGSSATASHIVTDLVKSAIQPGEPRFKVFCLSDNTPMLTAYANDVSYQAVFAEPLAALAEPGDVAFALSGSGNSPNVLAALARARSLGLTCVGLTGRDGGQMAPLCDVAVIVPADSMQVIEDAHLVILHAIFLAFYNG
ncbi:MAG: D-sedoheptulose-7-phosphate isomerase [Anaerolineae bacterium]